MRTGNLKGHTCGTCGTPWQATPCSALHADVSASNHSLFSDADREAIATFQIARKNETSWYGLLPWESIRWRIDRIAPGVGSVPETYFGSLFLPVWETDTPLMRCHSVAESTHADALAALHDLAWREYGCELAKEPQPTQ